MEEFIIEYQNYIRSILVLTIIIGVLTAGNIAGRLYYNIGKKKELFEKGRFFNGIFKAMLVVAVIVILTFSYLAFIYIDMLDKELVDPLILLKGASVLYFGTLIKTLADILGIELPKAKKEEIINEVITAVPTEPLLPDTPVNDEVVEAVEEVKEEPIEVVINGGVM